MRCWFALPMLLSLLAGCARPPESAFQAGIVAPKLLDAGRNTVGEPCTRSGASSSADRRVDVYCGTWREPSGHIVALGAAAGLPPLAELASASPWRAALDTRFTCAAPVPTTAGGGAPAVLMTCSRLVGGWPHLAVLAEVGGQVWAADGVSSMLPVLEGTIDTLSGRAAATAARGSGADALLADRLAATAIRSGDIGQYEQLMGAATRANLADSPVAAERAYRAALTLQQKAIGAGNPNTVDALLPLALQLSNQGRYAEADALFARAATLAPRSADQAAPARLLHYRALDRLNRNQPAAALAALRAAEARYAGLLPAGLLARAGRPQLRTVGFGRAAILLPDQDVLTDPVVQSALLGVIETRRYQAVALRDLGQEAASEAALASATRLARESGVLEPIVASRLSRTAGMIDAANARIDTAADALGDSASQFTQALPGSRAIARTALLQAGQLASAGRWQAALPACRGAVRLLRELASGIDADTVAPCLDVFHSAAMQGGGGAQGSTQGLLGEMFVAGQLGQSGVTSEQIAQAAARLAENTRDPHVADAIRRQQDATAGLAELYRERDAASAPAAPGAAAARRPADLDSRIAAAERALAETESQLQDASPNYGQLVQQVVDAPALLATLGPDEAFASTFLAGPGGWTFLLRDGRIDAAPIAGGRPRVAALVARIRASAEPNDAGVLPRFDTADSGSLYTILFGPLTPRLAGASRLTVAPSGPLLALPFAILLTGPADPAALAGAPWLVRQMAISHVPAPANFVSLRRIAAGSRAARPWFGMGDFVPVTLAQARRSFPGASCAEDAALFAGLPRLPFAQRELSAAQALLGASPGDELLGRDYTTAHVLQAALRQYRVLHFAAHALLPAQLRCISEPAIVTSAPPGAADAAGALLTASDIAQLQLDADLVVLSACNSGGPAGDSERTGGESLSGLARSFFYAGARSLLVTHWSVNDQTSAFLVASTLSKLKGGADAASALRDAELSILSAAGHAMPAELVHPFYWAPFALIGAGKARPEALPLDPTKA